MAKILVIEDNSSVLQSIVKMLRAEKFNVISAENGVIGLELANTHLPDLIICDIMMPQVDGYKVLTILQQEPATAAIPFIFLTAKADKADFRQGMELGSDDYLTKPFTRAELLSAINMQLAKRAMMRLNLSQKLNKLSSDREDNTELGLEERASEKDPSN